MKMLPSLALILVVSAARAMEAGPSFDCTEARGPVERAMCASAELSRLDRTLADAYAARSKSAGSDAASLRATQRSWLAARSALCSPDGMASATRAGNACLSLLYQKRIAELEVSAPPAGVYWQAESNTAMAITGDLLLSDRSVVMAGGYELPLQRVRSLPRESAVDMGGFDGAQSLELYRIALKPTADAKPRKLRNGNQLCGAGKAPTYLVVARSKDAATLSLAFFQGAQEPVWEKTALGSTHDLCGTFSYAAAAR